MNNVCKQVLIIDDERDIVEFVDAVAKLGNAYGLSTKRTEPLGPFFDVQDLAALLVC